MSAEKLFEDEDWIAAGRFKNSLARLLERYPEGAPDRVLAVALLVPEAEVPALWKRVLEKAAAIARDAIE